MFRLLHVRWFKRQPARAVLAIVAVAAGVAMTVSGGVLLTSIDGTLRDVLSDLAGPAPIRVVGPLSRAGLDTRVTERVERVEGVRSVVPVVQAVTIAERKDGRQVPIIALGVDCRIEALVGRFGCDEQTMSSPGNDAPVLVSASVARELGPGAVIRTDAGRVRTEGVTANDSLDGTNSGRIAIFDLPAAQRLFGRTGRLDALYVVPERDVDARELRSPIQHEVGEWNSVLLRHELAPSEGLNGPIMPLLTLAGIFALGLSALLVYNIVALTLAERRRDIAVASAVGRSPRAIVGGTLSEAGVIGFAGGVLGSIGGVFLGRPLVGMASKIWLEQTDGVPLQVHVSGRTLVTGVVLGVLTAMLASIVPAIRARRLDLAAELHGRSSAVEATRPRVARRLALLVIGTVIALAVSTAARRNGGLEAWQPTAAGVALFATAILIFAAAGTVAPLVLGGVLALLRRTGGSVRVGVANLVTQPRRTTVIASAVAAAVGLACVLGALIPAVRGTVGRSADVVLDGRVLVSTLPLNNSGNISARPSSEVLDALAEIPGVESVDRTYYVGIADTTGSRGQVGLYAEERPAPGMRYQRVAGHVGRGAVSGRNVLVGTTLARTHRVRVGSTLKLPTPYGLAELRVAGIWASTNNNGNSVEIDSATLRELYGDIPVGYVLLRPEPGVSAETVKRRVMDANLDPDLYALTPEEMVAQLSDEVASQAGPFWALQRMMLVVALVGTLSTLLLVGVQRRRELGILGATGFGPGALGRMTLTEGVATALAGGLLGAIASLVLFEALRNASTVSVGARPAFAADPLAAITATLLAVVVMAVGSAWPAWRTSRLQIVEAIRDE